MKHNRIQTNTIRTIKKSFPRFLSLIIMSLLGVLVFTGLTSTSPDMLNTLDKFLDDNNAYDLKIISTLGLTDKDIQSLKEVNSIKEVEGIYSKDVLVSKDESEDVLNISSIPITINTLELIEGRMPSSENEIVVEPNFLTKLGYSLNDTITIEDDNIKAEKLTIVGTVRSPLYYSNAAVNQNRGTTNIGNGTINYYSFILREAFDIDYYTNIYVTVENAKQEITSKNSYLVKIDHVYTLIESIKKEQEQNRFDSIYKEASDEILKNEEKANSELNDAKNKLDDAKIQLDKAKKELNSANTELTKAKKELNKANQEITAGEKELSNALQQYGIDDINASLSAVQKNITTLEYTIKNMSNTSPEYQTLVKNLEALKTQEAMLKTLQDTNNKLINARTSYKANYSKYTSSLQKYQIGLKEYNANLSKYDTSLKEYNENKTKITNEINDAKSKLNDITKPSWYIYKRADDTTYASYINQVESMKNLAHLFPVVFFCVAILVSLVSMNRMVEDDRGEIGTLKSLGFTNFEIKSKYLLFSSIATIIGATIGTGIGLTFIPYIIFSIYRLLFDVPNFQFGLNLSATSIGIVIAIICICGSANITANRILKNKPAELMRPKAPKSGKKIFLERIRPLWHHLKFSNKVTVRNLFRYKKRVLVTIFGICGCTALILCGFGIKDSIVDITNMQYDKTFKYDVTIYTKDLTENDIETITSQESITDYTLSETITGTYKSSNINMIVTESTEDLSKIVSLIDTENNEEIKLDENKVIITDKLADIHRLKIGDTIVVLDSNKKEYSFEISAIVKNYIGHNIYLSSATLESSRDNITYNPNVVYLNTIPLNEKEKDDVSNTLLKVDSVLNVIHKSTLMDSVKDMLNSLDKVVVILILLSAMLSFVVLYNLSNINISERTREIATLKVLGFYNKEVDDYITKETIILTIVGIILGLGFGYLLTNLTITTVEMENARFIRNISLNSYIYSAIISCIFTVIVNFVTHISLRKINMIESLKSVE